MFDISILVVLYGKKISDSSTLQSLSSLSAYDKKISLTIWNNGPCLLDANERATFKPKNFEITYIETINNISLALIYNEFLEQNVAKTYILLDHDSIVNYELFESYLNLTSNKVGLPYIYFNDVINAPFENGNVISAKQELSKNATITSIGSGLALGRDVVDMMLLKFERVFDERYYLYGVDTTFFTRLAMVDVIDNSVFVLLPGLQHSLSRLEEENDNITAFRILERSNDFGLSLRYYTPVYLIPIKFLYQLFKHVIYLAIHKKVSYNFFHVVKTFIKGQHYRSEL
ncbi:hypothetical protein ACPV40_18500 [Vibrio alfacsensis]|uniref:hypothetical protein n=1 Tax=Vibrio alfacsensis TaxID=1074311 RepID=UPI0040686025